MKSITRTKNLIIALFLGIVCLVAGLFFFAKKASDVVTANAEEVIPYIEGFDIETITLSTTPEYYKLRLGVNITLDMYIKLRNEGMNYLAVEVVNPDDPEETKQWYYYAKDNAYFYPEKIEIYDEEVENVENLEDLVNWTKPIKIYIPVDMPNNLQKAYKFRVYWFKLVNDNVGYRLLGGTDITNINVSKVAQTYLDTLYDKMTDEEIEWINHLAGYEVQDETFTLNLEYKEVAEFGRIETVTEQYQVDSHLVGVASRIYDTVMNLKGVRLLKEFNAIYKNPDGSPERIILQADGYTYSFDNTSGTGVLKIEYLDFKYKDFAIRVQDNDIDDNANLYYYIWATDITEKNNGITIHFEFSEIVKKCFNDLRWIFSLSDENFSVVNNSNIANSRIRLTQTGIHITFFESQQDELQNISILGIAEIIEDFSCDVTVKYSELSFENGTIVETKKVEIKSMMYSSYIQLSNFSIFKESVMYERVTSALQVAELGKQEYFIPYNLEAKKNADGSFTLQMLYNYNTLLQITDETNGKVHFIACTANSLTYNINLLGIAATTGWRIKSLSSEDPSVTINFDEANTSNLSVTVNTSTKEKKIIPIVVNYSDVWNLNIVYMRTYKDTPFALRTEETKQIKVSEYNPKAMTLTDIKRLLGRTDAMKVCGISIPDEKVKTELTSDSTYTATLSYGLCSINQIDYNGNIREIRVPLTSFADWAKTFGDEDLTILALNKEEQYFEYSNDVDREKLYGFFSMAVFEEQVSDFNYYFRNNTGAGNMVMFEQREVTGSSVYQFFGNLREKGPIASIYGHVGMTYCEILNDDNKILHSVFFYMDATEGYISDGGADDKNDTDGAFDNTTQDVVDKVEDWWSEMSDGMETVRIAIAAVLGLALAGFIAFGVIWLIKYYKKKE